MQNAPDDFASQALFSECPEGYMNQKVQLPFSKSGAAKNQGGMGTPKQRMSIWTAQSAPGKHSIDKRLGVCQASERLMVHSLMSTKYYEALSELGTLPAAGDNSGGQNS